MFAEIHFASQQRRQQRDLGLQARTSTAEVGNSVRQALCNGQRLTVPQYQQLQEHVMLWYANEVWAAGRPCRRRLFQVIGLAGMQANALRGSCTSRHSVEQIVMTIADLSTTPKYCRSICRSMMITSYFALYCAVHQLLVYLDRHERMSATVIRNTKQASSSCAVRHLS